MKNFWLKIAFVSIASLLLFSFFKDLFFNKNHTEFVNVYSSRKEELTKELFEKFTKETGIKVNLLTDDAKKLISRLKQEDYLTEADVFLGSDVGNLQLASDMKLLSDVESEILNQNIPENLRTNQWFGLSKRVRAIFYAKNRVDVNDLSTYENLATKKWRDRVLIRSSSNVYNQSLISSIIEKHTTQKANKWVYSFVKNFARSPQGGDTDQLYALAAGEGDIAIANSYYFGRLINSENEDDKKVADQIGIFFPNQKYDGAHVNLSGGGVIKHSKRKDKAIKLLEFLSSDYAQKKYAQVNFEYPIKEGIKLPKTLKNWGEFKGNEKIIKKFVKYNYISESIARKNNWN